MLLMQVVRFIFAILFLSLAILCLLIWIFGGDQFRHVYTNLRNPWPNWPNPLIKSEWVMTAGNGQLRIDRLYAEGSFPAESGWTSNGWIDAPYIPATAALRGTPTGFSVFGFTLHGWKYKVDRMHGGTYAANDWAIAVPLWSVLATCLVIAASSFWRIAKHNDRRLLGLCRKCGYDLRATPDRCPECGTPTSLKTNPFRLWRPAKRFADALTTPVSGRPAEDVISEDRDRG